MRKLYVIASLIIGVAALVLTYTNIPSALLLVSGIVFLFFAARQLRAD